eukprot:TRINITY_DN2606_c0_g4_i1.p1 TRINITY_DN2606_c0_g4~~TRINITY_DN2606_c0_g4_i1.p1  ORF type:complete len:409 (-),score=137.32 TRINITY_DN2606_c0_g4_i1:50-1276(-)
MRLTPVTDSTRTPNSNFHTPESAPIRTISDSEIVYEPQSIKLLFKTYWVGLQLGKGSYGRVKEAVDRRSRRLCAIKIINKRKCKTSYCDADSDVQEVEVLECIPPHPNVSHMIEHYENKDRNKVYIVMNHSNGGTLQQLLDKHEDHPLPDTQTRKLFRDLIRGLQHLHRMGVIHRDIKPGNLLLSTSFCLRVSDFGVAEFVVEENEEVTKEDGTKEMVKKRVSKRGGRGQGAPAYQPPEYASGNAPEPAHPSVDIWSAGVVLYQMATGKYPFPEGGSVFDILEAIASCDYTIPSFVDPLLADLIRGVMSSNPDNRLTTDQILDHPWMNQSGASESLQDDWVEPDPVESWFEFDENGLALIPSDDDDELDDYCSSSDSVSPEHNSSSSSTDSLKSIGTSSAGCVGCTIM